MVFISGQAFADWALATKSGCSACHKIDAKVVGPPFACIAKRYAAEKAAKKAELVAKVKAGGKGAWTEGDWAYLKAAIPMPPYQKRVTDEDIAKLVDFVLAQDASKCPPK
jgi:cytochrome c